jgi:hypothetical protein
MHTSTMFPRLASNSWAQACLLPLPPECWDYRCVSPYPASHLDLKNQTFTYFISVQLPRTTNYNFWELVRSAVENRKLALTCERDQCTQAG